MKYRFLIKLYFLELAKFLSMNFFIKYTILYIIHHTIQLTYKFKYSEIVIMAFPSTATYTFETIMLFLINYFYLWYFFANDVSYESNSFAVSLILEIKKSSNSFTFDTFRTFSKRERKNRKEKRNKFRLKSAFRGALKTRQRSNRGRGEMC